MTIDLKEHIAKKQQEADKKAYDAIGDILMGIPLGSALNILAGLVFSATVNMEDDHRARVAGVFHQILMTKPHKGLVQ
jgi:hypothetical protein